MKADLIKGMLLIEEPSIYRLYEEMMQIANYFVAPVFMIALLIEYFGDYNFAGVVKKLLIITLFMSFFYQFHTHAVDVALESSSNLLQKVSPRNIFVKKWTEVKIKTKEKADWGLIEKFAIPNLNDIVATAFFLISKVFIWLLKLIYSTVYHFTYVFSGITAVLYFLGWTKDAIKGTVQGSLWCLLMPFVIVAILALVGNSFEDVASDGELVFSKIDTIVWLFGVTLLLLLSPVITYGMIRGEGIQSFGAKMGTMLTSSAMKMKMALPLMMMMSDRSKGASTQLFNGVRSVSNVANKSKSDIKEAGVTTATPPSYLEKSLGRNTISSNSVHSPPPAPTASMPAKSVKPSSESSNLSFRMTRAPENKSYQGRGVFMKGRGIATTPTSKSPNYVKEKSNRSQATNSRVVDHQNKHTQGQHQVKKSISSKVERIPQKSWRSNELR